MPVALRPGDERPLDDVVDALAAAAYTRTDLVERRGEFAVRGGILDVFPPTEEHPVRVEFWGDTVEEVRWFKVADQRSLEVAEHGLWAPPCRELLLTDDVRARAAALATQLPGVADMLAKVAEGIAVEGMESLAPALVDGMESVLDVLPAERSIVLLADPERVRTRAHDLVAHERRVPRGQLGQRGRRQPRARRPAVGARHRLLLDARPGARARRRDRTRRGGR